MNFRIAASCAALAVALVGAGAAGAQSKVPVEQAEGYGTAQTLNADVAKHNDDVRTRNAQAQADYQAQLAAFKAAQARYEAQVAQTKAQAAEAERRHAADLAAWQAQVAACKAGDYVRCGGEGSK